MSVESNRVTPTIVSCALIMSLLRRRRESTNKRPKVVRGKGKLCHKFGAGKKISHPFFLGGGRWNFNILTKKSTFNAHRESHKDEEGAASKELTKVYGEKVN